MKNVIASDQIVVSHEIFTNHVKSNFTLYEDLNSMKYDLIIMRPPLRITFISRIL